MQHQVGVGMRSRRRRIVGWLRPLPYIVPAVVTIGFIFAYPLVRLARESTLQSYGGVTQNVGWSNYQFVLTDSDFVTAVTHNLLLLLFYEEPTVLSTDAHGTMKTTLK